MIRKDPKTFCHEPEGPPEIYENWLESFDPSEYEDEMTRIMMSCSEVQELYDKLVPSSVSHLEFWQRYFYRVHLLRKAETKRADLMRRAEQISIADVEWNENTSGEIKNSAHIHNSEKFAASVLKAEDAERNAVNSNANQVKHSPYRSELTRESAQSIPAEVAENDTDAKKTLKTNEHIAVPNISSTDCAEENVEKTVTEVLSETTDIQTELSSEDSTDGSRLSPVESLGKG
ncbi:BSD domain-containing protein 1-like [Stegodyphus dumicola]|uniref:BSD domain-containing protein 1-like n=1 Tax=Stegodyphus dumicola TaxID=202533 RepID=UPI0015B0D5CB|nr:BSD domain-containing protein 1-like [Stegodyphus dumicola]